MALKNKINLAMCGLALASVGIVANASAIEYDGDGLSNDGKFHINMAPPSNNAEKQTLSETIAELTENNWGLMGWENGNPAWKCNESLTACKLVNLRAAGWEWTDDYYDIVYEYDPVAKERIDAVLANFEVPEGGFFVSDAELMKYWAFGGNRLAAVSSEVKTALDNMNLDFVIDVRAGARDDLWDEELGMGKVYYNGCLYAVIGGNGFDTDPKVVAPHIFFVEDGSKDLMSSLINRFVAIYGEEARDAVGIQATGQKVRDFVNADDEFYDYFKDYLDASAYEMTISQGELGDSYMIAIVADSDKIEKVSGVDSTDILTDINIKTVAENLPGDAATQAENLGSDDEGIKEDFGDKFNAYEIGLYSVAMDGMITDSDDGFTVSIPVPEILKDVEAISAYWKNFETGELEEHPAEIVDGNAVFETTHFSTYVLAEATEKPVEPEAPVEPDAPTGPFEPDTPAQSEDGTVVPGAPDTGSSVNNLSSVVASLPIFGTVIVATGVVALVLSKRK